MTVCTKPVIGKDMMKKALKMQIQDLKSKLTADKAELDDIYWK